MFQDKDDGRVLALEAAMQWLFFRVVSSASEPQRLLDEFVGHMKAHAQSSQDYADTKLSEGDFDSVQFAYRSLAAIEQISESLVLSVDVKP